jgi:CubicO group peptidase (beta-lactamase class C family)
MPLPCCCNDMNAAFTYEESAEPGSRGHESSQEALRPVYTPVVAGISVAFTSPAGISAEASGTASPDGTPLTSDSMLQAGSVSKAVTAYAAHRLAAEGRLDLDADVNEILTSWQLPRVGEWRPGVTVRDLLAHMAGVSGSWGDGTARGEPVPGLLEILAGTAAAPPVALAALPGLTWAYSGGGYLIVAQVICDVTGLAFAEAMAELVLDPAGMTASTFRQPLPGSLEPAAAWGHQGGEPVSGGWRNQPDTGAVGLWTTPSDLVRFAVAVSAERSVQMLHPHPAEPRMGSGVFLATSDRGVRWWSHTGLVTGYASLLASSGGFSVAIMANDSQAEDLIAELFGDLAVSRGPGPVQLTNLFGESIRRWIGMTARQDRFVGTYVLPWGAEVHVTAPMGQHAPELHLTLPGQPPVRLLPATPHRWYVSGIAGTDIAFIPPDSLRISQHGRHLDARRAQAP